MNQYNQPWRILQGDCLKLLTQFEENTFDAIITDPPYASGGHTQAEKNKPTARKYSPRLRKPPRSWQRRVCWKPENE